MGALKLTTTCLLPLAQITFDYKLKKGSKHTGKGIDGERSTAVKHLSEVQPVKTRTTEKTQEQVQTVYTCTAAVYLKKPCKLENYCRLTHAHTSSINYDFKEVRIIIWH